MNVYTMTEADLAKQANEVLGEVVMAMNKEGLIAETQATNFLETHGVIVVRKGFFNRVLDKVLGISDDGFRYYIVKIVK